MPAEAHHETPAELAAVPTAKLVRRARQLSMFAAFRFFAALRLDVKAAEVEHELVIRARRVHPSAMFDGREFQIPFPPNDPQQTLAVPAEDFDTFAALCTEAVR